MQVPLMRLQCGCNSYEWGKVGKTSAAAKLASATGFEVQDDKPYAELWMGTHPSLPAKDVETNRSLLELVQDNKALLNHDVAQKYGNKLPFLFKVLSISKALSIQAHPNKKEAEHLHAKDPRNYPAVDDNHKPEMTIAVTPFDGLCGFRPLAETAYFLETVPSLRQLVGEDASSNFIKSIKNQETASDTSTVESNKKALQAAFSALMKNASSSASDTLKTQAEQLVTSAHSLGSDFASGGGPGPNSGKQLSDLIIRLNSQFPNDIGLFVLFFLNYVQLEVGEAMFLKADDIHAYLSGDIIECMASSDNVVRAGFTPKFKDVDTLTDMLTYSYAPIEEQKMHPQDYAYVKLDRAAYSANSSAILYDPPIEEFSVVKTDLKANGAKATFESIDGPSIIICTSGSGTISVGPKVEPVETGYVYFVGATAECVLESKGEEPFTSFKAFCELEEKEPVTNGKM
ncbi:MAG: Mannose-6-phosphate isomerase [Chrysothrix sp. TS-e1954]|nr:MAG: Mannose-6-phosphate isomerase [Chrysothrix sp. TS-e1954]